MFSILILIFLVLSGLCIKYWPSVFGNDWLSIFFIVGLFLYYAAIPIESIVFGYSEIVVGSQVVILDDSFRLMMLGLGILALTGFMTALLLTSTKDRKHDPSESSRQAYSPRGVSVMTLSCVLLLVILFRDLIVASGSYYGNVHATYNQPTYSFLILLAITGGSIMVAMDILKKNKLTAKAVALTAICIAWGVYSSNKDPIIIAVFSLLICLHIYKSRKVLVVVLLPVVILLASLTTISFSIYRGGSVQSGRDFIVSVAERTNDGIFRHLDPAGPIVSLSKAVGTRDRLLGATYLEAAYSWIPRAIWPGRPLDLSERNARQLVKRWQPGFGLGYSPLAEGYINFGILGAFIQYFLFGLIWGFARRLVLLTRNGKSILQWSAVFWACSAYMFLVMHRGPFSAYIKTGLQIVIPLLIVWFFIDKISWTPLLQFYRRSHPISNFGDAHHSETHLRT